MARKFVIGKRHGRSVIFKTCIPAHRHWIADNINEKIPDDKIRLT